MLVIVDVLSFSTAVDIATARGAAIYPFALGDRAAAERAAADIGAVLAYPRSAGLGQFSLSPQSLLRAEPGLKMMLPSPNGSRLTLQAGDVPTFSSCLRNAAAVAAAVRSVADGRMVTVIAAGERWSDGSLRPAIEDMLGAGALIHHLDIKCSAEALVMRDAYRSAGANLAWMIRDSVSGRELIDAGFGGDVDLAVDVGASSTAPGFIDGAYRA